MLIKRIFFIYFWSCRSLLLCAGLFSLVVANGATLCNGAWASHCSGSSCCRAQGLECGFSSCGMQASFAPWHVGSSQSKDRIHVSCIGRQIPNHKTTREILMLILIIFLKVLSARFHHCKPTISLL